MSAFASQPTWLSAATCALLVAAAGGCSSDDPAVAPADIVRPTLLVRADRKQELLDRLDRAPYAAVLARLQEVAAREVLQPDPAVWDHSTIGHNNDTANANAVLAWLFDDPAAAQKARDILLCMPTDFETNDTWDVNIRMPHVLIPYVTAWDLLRSTPWLPEAEAQDAAARVTAVTEKFFNQYVGNGVMRQLLLGVSQNNHPIRTAAGIAAVALAYPEHPLSGEWASWALSELDYLFSAEGRYLQSDGGVSEGPFYYGFAYAAAMALFIIVDNAVDPARLFPRDCRNRQPIDPWLVTDCQDGELFAFDSPLRSQRLRDTIDWSISLRLPDGYRAPLADAYFNTLNGGALLTGFGGDGHTRWDWEHTQQASPPMTHGLDLIAYHLCYVDDEVPVAEPPWRNRFLPAAGNAVFRSGWDEEARWLLLVAEQGSARKTLHDHVDGTSFSLAAYGDYLLLDPGYYKPDELDNAQTSQAPSHNVILIDGQGAPEKGLLTAFGDEDAFLRHTVDGTALAYAEAHQSYEETSIERSVVFVRQRYFIVADRLESAVQSPRTHTWRVGGWAGYDSGGTFEIFDCLTSAPRCGAHFARERGGVHVHLASTAPGLTVGEPPYEPLSPPHVGQFDTARTIEDHGVADGVVDAAAPGFLAVLAPYKVGEPAGAADGPLTVTALGAGTAAAAWQIAGAGGTEIVWLRGAGASATLALPGGGTLASDAALTVVDQESGAFGLIARGSEALLDGQPVVSGDATQGVITSE